MNQFGEALTILREFNRQGVNYLVIGGAAVNVHGFTRATGDLDIWYDPTPSNFKRLLSAIEAAGFDISALAQGVNPEKSFIRLPFDPFSVELLGLIDGKLDFHACASRALRLHLDDIIIPVLGYDDLIQNKVMSRRAKDLEDIAQLERRRRKQE